MSWNLNIEKAKNGYYITIPKKDGEHLDQKIVFQIDEENNDEDNAEQSTLLELFYFLQSEFWVTYSKHNRTNISLSIETMDTNDED